MNTVFVSYAAHETNYTGCADHQLCQYAGDRGRVPLEAGTNSTKIVKKLTWKTGVKIWRCQ